MFLYIPSSSTKTLNALLGSSTLLTMTVLATLAILLGLL